jgi:hypothetical protein
MILACVCGRRYRIPGESNQRGRTCPQCGGVLQPEGEALAPAIDINVLIEQMRVLRDELVARDRQLRKAQAESTVLKAELDQLRARTAGSKVDDRPARPAHPGSPLQMPSDRVSLS